MEFNDLLTRTGAAAELPLQIADELVTGTIRTSTALALGRSVPTMTRDSRIPVLTQLPQAYWTGPLAGAATADAGMIQTTEAIFANTQLIAEELGCIVPIPNSIIEDSGYDLFAAVKPLMEQAMAKAIDNAVIFGVGQPATFTQSVVAHAAQNGNVISGPVFVTTGATPTDNAGLVLQGAQLVSQQGRNVTACAVSPGWQYRAGVARTAALVANPLASSTPFPLLLGGIPLKVDPVRWPNALQRTDAVGGTTNASPTVTDASATPSDLGLPISGTGIPAGATIAAVNVGVGYTISANATATGATALVVGTQPVDAIVGAWDHLLIGLRKEITMTVFTEGVISDNNGLITLNLITQNVTAVRLTMRIGALVVNEPTDYVGAKSPFALIVNSGTLGPVGVAEDEDEDEPIARKPANGRK
jgi:hypothetical protein